MITLITGTPGAGKTLYAISKLLLPLIGTTVKKTLDDGAVIELPRTIYTNINGLLIEHELVTNGDTWELVAKEWKQSGDNKLGLHNWHEWAKPGSVICADEFQRTWPPRPNGAAVPPDVQAMDTHRHMGVDFILISQHANNFDKHIQGLVGRHLHVRRMGNLGLTIVYEWDHCSRSLMYSKSLAKGPWRFDKKVFKLYKSAEVHTKQPRRLPALLFVILAAAGMAAWKIPESYARISSKVNGVPPAGASSLPSASALLAQQAASGAGRASVAPHEPAPIAAPVASSSVLAVPEVRPMGCIATPSRCECFAPDGAKLTVSEEVCREGSHRVGFTVPGRGDGGSAPMVTSRGVPVTPTTPSPGAQPQGDPLRSMENASSPRGAASTPPAAGSAS